MCGIAAILDPTRPADAHRDALDRMVQALAHRGPDGDGRYLSGSIALGHTRLALQDAEHNQQPRLSVDGRYAIVFNGEIYNSEELAHSLAQEYPFESASDTEVLMALLALDGARGLHRLDGMFAFVLWDSQTRTLTAARDRLGVKPLHFERISGGGLRLASEAQALLAGRAPGQARRLHLEAFREWAVAPAFSGVERPLFDGLETLPPGHVLTWRAGQTEVKRWGGFVPMRGARAEELVIDDIPRRVFMAVGRASAAEVPLGVFLSGGFDSTLIAAVAGYQAEDVRAFTVRFEGQDGFDYARSQITFEDDSPFAQHALDELDLEGEEVLVSRATLAGDLAAMARINDALPAWEQELAQHHLSRAARQHVKAVLVGDAADETHFGYHFLLDPTATASPLALLARLGAPERLKLLAPDLRNGLLEQLAGRYTELAAEDGHGWGDRRAQLGATSSLLVKRWLGRLLHNGDIHTMAFGLEARVPFADTFLLDSAEQIGPEVGLKNGIEKWHLREAMDDVPDRIRWRKKSALPKDQGAEPVYRVEAQKVLHEADAGFWRLLDRGTVEALVRAPAPLSELERAMLFQTISLHHFVRHHALRSL